MRIGRNATWNIVEVAASSAALFLLYKVIVTNLGVQALGVWSLVLATTSMARIADLGVSGGLGRFVAEAQANSGGTGSELSPLAYIETALFANTAIFLSVAALAYWPAHQALAATLSGPAEVHALALLPYALASFVLMNLSAVMTSSLLGLHRSDIKSMLMIFSMLLQLVIALLFARSHGLVGVALGQVAQGAFMAASGWIAVCTILAGKLSLRLPTQVVPRLLKPLFGFGLRLQSVTLASFLYEPAVKFVIAATSGVAALGLFEMAFRLITQSRQFIASPSQNLLPLYVDALTKDRPLDAIYGNACAIMWPVAGIGFIALTILSPLISLLWIGHIDYTLIIFVAVLSCGWFVNVAAIPAFHIGMASGRLKWNIAGSAVTSAIAIVLGWPLGSMAGGLGNVVGASAAVAVGGAVILLGNTRDAGIRPLPLPSHFQHLALRIRALVGNI